MDDVNGWLQQVDPSTVTDQEVVVVVVCVCVGGGCHTHITCRSRILEST